MDQMLFEVILDDQMLLDDLIHLFINLFPCHRLELISSVNFSKAVIVS